MVLILSIIFIIGYFLITLENKIGINKAALALLTGVLCWCAYLFMASDSHLVSEQLMHHLSEISGILFFLLGAMTIVELIDAHDGFHIIITAIKTTNKRKLLWILCIITFLLSAVLDNLTTTILMVSLLRKIIPDKNDRWLFLGLVIIAANAGGAWSPIGDVTTTMLWIGGQITGVNIIMKLIIPSAICLLVPLTIASLRLKGNIQTLTKEVSISVVSKYHRYIIFFSGIGVLLGVPLFKSVTHLPPFMGMLLGLGILWIISEIIHKDKDTDDKDALSVVYALRKIDTPSILFFLGILVAISALQSAGVLTQFAEFLDRNVGSESLVVMIIGLFSAIVDNVPLVAASIGMYDLSQYPTDHFFWQFLALSTGTGGSALIIGSAAGVAVMGMENMDFFWYLKNISWLALIGFFAGAITFIAFFS
ncbi:MAG: sodium:proton antiporter NhaD [Bacteroidota bacterium]|nr:sodium:proton antiporter NhaD [Bacteroidota bacterium]